MNSLTGHQAPPTGVALLGAVSTGFDAGTDIRHPAIGLPPAVRRKCSTDFIAMERVAVRDLHRHLNNTTPTTAEER